jgi:type IV secretory pathway VirB10-like protein
MSSAILYLAIIAIWLCVLVPRWLKRDSARGAAVAPEASASDTAGPADAPVTAADGDGEADLADDGTAEADEHDGAPGPSAPTAPADPPAAPLSAEESRRRIMAGRRRLLGMLIALEIAAIALAFLGLAALWVVIPPSIMLIGYVLLLREAAAADSERAEREAEAAAHARDRERAARAKAPAAHRATPAAGTPSETAAEAAAAAAALAAKFAAAPVPADNEESGRDFAPGLAGKYTTSNADHEPVAEDYTYEPPRLRAVGD